MTNDLLHAPERATIEAFILKLDTAESEAPSYERLLGFLSGVVITPGLIMPSQWLQPLLDRHGIIFQNMADAGGFTGALLELYNRINDLRLQEVNLCPFKFNSSEELEANEASATGWGTGLHDALTHQAGVWAPPGKKAVRHIPKELLGEMEGAIPFLWALAEPEAIEEIMPDPVPFQKNFLGKVPGWQEDMLVETWDEELKEMFVLFCLGQLHAITDTLQRYSKAYGKGTQTAIQTEPVNRGTKVGRNDPCPCDSGKKFKKCCGA
jgi:uncharacterized protein